MCATSHKESVDDGATVNLTSDRVHSMNLKEHVDAVSQETSIPAGQVKKSQPLFFRKFGELIEKEEGFRSPIIRFSAKSRNTKESIAGKPAKPERKAARMIVTPEKKEIEENSQD